MPLAGGPSDKAGNCYEAYWTIDKLLDVLDGRYASIRLEPPAHGDRGFEFVLRSSAGLEFHQVKRQQSSRGQWSLADLASYGVLENFQRKLGNDQTACVFISTQDVPSLRELGERARAAQSFSEFEGVFLSSDSLKQAFGELRARWSQSPAEAVFDRLRTTFVETVSETTLHRFLENRAASIIEGNPATSIATLFSLIFSRVHQELTAYDIWNELKTLNITPNRWGSSPPILAAVEEQNARYVSRLNRELIGGFVIERHVARTAITFLLSENTRRALMLTGSAGAGKSSVMLQVANALSTVGIPLLSFRVDVLKPVTTPDEVGRQIGLPASPARVLAAIAQGRRGVLIIDQLDAVSKVSGRNAQFFDCVLEIIEQAKAFPNLQLALACRHFDLENDHRLHRLIGEQGIAKPVKVPTLTPDEVKEAVTRIGLDSSYLTGEQLTLLSLPFNLSLLARIPESLNAAALNFTTLHELFALFWEEKRRRVSERSIHAVRWNDLIDKICEYMSSQQCLSAPLSRLDDYRDDVEALVSEHVLVFEGRVCSFSHESLFDYAFARRFVARQGSVATWLRNDTQDLFRRSQVRQILQYLRNEDRKVYLAELSHLLQEGPLLRFHLEWMIFAWLGDLDDPSSAEWKILQPTAEVRISRFQLIVSLLRRNAAWFQLALTQGDIEKWLRSNDEIRNIGSIEILASNVDSAATAVCELLKLHSFDSPVCMKRAKWVLRRANLGANRCLFDCFTETIRRGGFDRSDTSSKRDEFWSYVYPIADENAVWAVEAIREMLSRSLHISIARGETNPFSEKDGSMPQDTAADHTIDQIYRRAPAAFVLELLDCVIRIIKLNELAPQSEHLVTDSVWRWRQFDSGHDLASKVLLGIEYGLRAIARDNPDLFRTLRLRLIGNRSESLHFLLARGYAANGQLFADEGVEFLLDHPDHLSLGYMGDSYASIDLLKSTSPFCNEKLLSELETRLMNFYPPYEKRAGIHGSFGYAQFNLLSVIDSTRRSLPARKRLRELESKFGKGGAELQPRIFSAEFVPSPIPSAALDKMNDSQWLGAVMKYNQERFVGGHLRGGALQLSQALYNCTKVNPRRFVGLLKRLTSEVHPYYVSNILRALSDADAEPSLILDACRHADSLDGRPFGQWICYCIGRLADHDLSDEDLSIASWYATEDPNPKCSHAKEISEIDEQDTQRLLLNGLNSVRGAAANAIARLIFSHPGRLELFRGAVHNLAMDCSLPVKSQAAAALLAALTADRDFAVREFLVLCDADEALLGTSDVERFLYFAISTHFDLLEPVLQRMLRSTYKFVRAAGARQITLAALSVEGAHTLLGICLSGDGELRAGTAEVLAANVGSANHRHYCTEALSKLFLDESVGVRAKASACFASFKIDDFAAAEQLAFAFMGSPAFEDNHHHLLDALDKSEITLPELTLQCCEEYVKVVGKSLPNPSTSVGFSAESASRLIVRVYGQSSDRDVRNRCLDLVDSMLGLGVLHMTEALKNVER